jgi:AraC-like DNA-binding protein
MAVTRLRVPHGLARPTLRVTPEPAFTVSVHLHRPDSRGWGTWIDGRFYPADSWEEGGVGIYDLESDPIALRGSAFDAVHFYLPRTTLNAFTAAAGLPTVGALTCRQGARDVVLHHLAQIFLPGLGREMLYPQLFFDHFAQMICGHLVSRYGGGAVSPGRFVGGLAPWQRRRMQDLLHDHAGETLTLARLAAECHLSVTHFARSFRTSFGTSVRRYLIQQRVEAAKALLLRSGLSLAEIAVQTGFSDQSSLNRTFHNVVGVPPGRWRRERCRGLAPEFDSLTRSGTIPVLPRVESVAMMQ